MSTSSEARIPTIYGNRERYADNWKEKFAERYFPLLREEMTILDVGSGRLPAIPRAKRPANCRYIGLDISAVELDLAPVGSYDETFVRDLRDHEPALVDQIDLVISWQVLEHIRPLSHAINNVYSYLKPNGHFIALLSGRNAHFALLNRLIPEKIGVYAMDRLLNRPPDSVFRAHYDSCTYSDLIELTEGWSQASVETHFRGAGYLRFAPPLQHLYLLFEDWAEKSGRRNLGTHYTLHAIK